MFSVQNNPYTQIIQVRLKLVRVKQKSPTGIISTRIHRNTIFMQNVAKFRKEHEI